MWRNVSVSDMEESGPESEEQDQCSLHGVDDESEWKRKRENPVVNVTHVALPQQRKCKKFPKQLLSSERNGWQSR